MNLRETVETHPLIVLTIVVAVAVGATWVVATEVLVRPRDFQIQVLQHQVENLQQALAREINPTSATVSERADDGDASRRPFSDETLATLAQGKNFAPISMAEFFEGLYAQGMTQLQRDEFAEEHIGKRVVWTGQVKSVEADPDEGISLIFHAPGEAFHSAFCEFANDNRSTLLRLREGQEIKLTGVIRNVIASPFLEDCQVLEIPKVASQR